MAQAIDRAEWEHYCERVSKALATTEGEIEVDSLALGSQVETRWLPFIGISYDPNDDVIDVALEGVDHIVEHPRELRAETDIGGLQAIQIIDREGMQHLVRLRQALALPAPH
jgi:hypothetical protein